MRAFYVTEYPGKHGMTMKRVADIIHAKVCDGSYKGIVVLVGRGRAIGVKDILKDKYGINAVRLKEVRMF